MTVVLSLLEIEAKKMRREKTEQARSYHYGSCPVKFKEGKGGDCEEKKGGVDKVFPLSLQKMEGNYGRKEKIICRQGRTKGNGPIRDRRQKIPRAKSPGRILLWLQQGKVAGKGAEKGKVGGREQTTGTLWGAG